MKTQLPQPIAAYIQATNAHDIDALLASFTPDALVIDEGQKYHGVAQIRAWREKTNEQYQFTLDVIDITEGGNETVVTTLVSGNFDRQLRWKSAPASLSFHPDSRQDCCIEHSRLTELNQGRCAWAESHELLVTFLPARQRLAQASSGSASYARRPRP